MTSLPTIPIFQHSIFPSFHCPIVPLFHYSNALFGRCVLNFLIKRIYSRTRVSAMDETETLGKYLRRERELRKISLRELSKNTRVREHLLKAIEEDRHDLLPSPTFVKGFLNAYAKYIGLDANEIILRYQRGLTGTTENGPDATPEKEPGQDGKHRRAVGGCIAGGVIVAGLSSTISFSSNPRGHASNLFLQPLEKSQWNRRPRHLPRFLPKSQSPLPPRKPFRPHLLRSSERLPRNRNRLLRRRSRQSLRRLRSRHLLPPLPRSPRHSCHRREKPSRSSSRRSS